MPIQIDTTIAIPPYLINDSSTAILEFLTLHTKSNSVVRRNIKSILYSFLNFVQKQSIFDINETDCIAYFQTIMVNSITAKTYWSRINSFFKYCERRFRSEKFVSPLPPRNEINFNNTTNITSLEEFTHTEEQEVLTIEQIKQILSYYHTKNYTFYILILILLFTGARPSEVLSIRLSNLDLSNRVFLSGMELNARKSNKDGKHPLLFVLPQEIIPIFYYYIKEVHQKRPSTEWVFPSLFKKGNHLLYSYIQNYIDKTDCPVKFTARYFRKTLATFRKRFGVPREFRELLSNHVITSVEDKHYAKCTIYERRELYDKYLPPEYKDLLKFVRTL